MCHSSYIYVCVCTYAAAGLWIIVLFFLFVGATVIPRRLVDRYVDCLLRAIVCVRVQTIVQKAFSCEHLYLFISCGVDKIWRLCGLGRDCIFRSMVKLQTGLFKDVEKLVSHELT